LGAVVVEKISGSFSGVVGLPIEQTAKLLRTFNVPIWGVSNKNI
jgi:septum formation protein